ncbi:MAG: TonB-dependent receptor [Bryobacterales bacterium]|nr:TonB-dependent receptor [Bryobacterales bacterium]
MLRPSILLLAAVTPLAAQFAAITGRVTDPSGAALPEVRVSAKNEGTAVTAETLTNNEGYFALPNLVVGAYTVESRKQGFSVEQKTDLRLQVGQTARIDFQMKIGSVVSSVDVQGIAPVIQSETSSVGAVIESRQVLGVPLNGRSLFNLLALAPGVQNAGTSPRVGGGPGNSNNNFTIDGTSNNDTISARGEGAFPSLDMVAEFEIINVNAPAEFGRGGAQIRVVTKSGTNDFHGSLFHYNRNREFAARNFFAPSRPPFNRNEFGGSVGGPAFLPKVYNGRNRTFFFFVWEGLRERSPRTNTLAVPTAAQRTGNFAGLREIIDPLTGSPFPGNQIPANRIHPAAAELIKYYPLPNQAGTGAAGTGFNYVTNLSNQPQLDNWSLRIDHSIGSNDRIFGRFLAFTNGPYFQAGPAAAGFNNGYFGFLDRNFTFSWTHLFSPSVTNDFKFGTIYNNNFRNTGNPDLDLSRLIPGLFPITPGAGGVPTMNIPGYTQLTENQGTTSGGSFKQYSHNWINNTTWVRGKHMFKGGMDLNFNKSYDKMAIRPYPRGYFDFQGIYSRDALADFLLGYPTVAQRSTAFGGSTQPGASVYGLYFQDDWRLTPKLTLNLGVRYEVQTQYEDRDGNYANFDLANNRIVVPNFNGGVSPGASPQLVSALPVVTNDKAGFPNKLVAGDHNNLAPRIGFAYKLMQNTVVRGGYGMYYGSTFGDQFLSFPKNPPFVLTERLEAPAGATPSLTLSNAFPTAGSAPRNPSFTAFDPNIKMNEVHQANITVEQQITASLGLRVSFLSQNFRHTWRAYDANQPRTFGPGPTQDRRPLQPWSSILYYDSGGSQISNSLQVGIMKRYSHGLLFQAEYQYVRAIGDDLYTGPQDIRNFRADRANLSGIRRQVLTMNYLYDLPFGKGKAFLNVGGPLNYVIGGWQVGGITTFATGTPFSPSFTATLQGAPSGRPDVVGDWHVDAQDITRWFNAAAFAVPAPYTFGSAGKNTLIGPGLITIDASVYKNFRFAERVNLQFRSEFFNLPNHANFANPAANISFPGQVGRITATSTANRVIQFGLRLTF